MITLQCSIDSLLERTIKHMLFLQSITKHADKLNKCADAKVNIYGFGLVHNFLTFHFILQSEVLSTFLVITSGWVINMLF